MHRASSSQCLAEADETLLEVFWFVLLDLPDIEIDKAHGKHVVGEEDELVLAVGVVGLEGVPQIRESIGEVLL